MVPLIKTENIRVVYNPGKSNEFVALADVNIEIFPQEYVIFFGPSGCGKSTLLYTLLGLQKAASGKVFIEGKDIATLKPKEKAGLSSDFFGIIFQNFNLIYSLNVLDNVALPQMFKGVDVAERKVRALKLLERFGIGTKAYSLPGALSGGQQQRVATCRALINDQKVLLADEPVGNLDSESAMTVMRTLMDINQKDKKTIILVTHDSNYLHFADRIYYFKDGKIDRCVTGQKSTQVLAAKPQQQEAAVPTSPGVQHLTSDLLSTHSSHQLIRASFAVDEYLSSKISKAGFCRILTMPLADGGVGMYKKTAAKFAGRVYDFAIVVRTYRRLMQRPPSENRGMRIGNILAKYLTSNYRGRLSLAQSSSLSAAARDRLSGKIAREEFEVTLSAPLKAGGVGLRAITAEHFSDTLEDILLFSNKSKTDL